MRFKTKDSMKRCSTVYSTSETPLQRWETNDCTVRTMTTLTRLPYAVCHAAAEEAGRKAGKGFSVQGTARAMLKLGADVHNMLEDVWKLSEGLGRLPTLKKFVTAFPKGAFAVATHDHMFAVIDGVVHDWGRHSSGARCRIVSALKVKSLA